MKVQNPFGRELGTIKLPDNTNVLKMNEPKLVRDAATAIKHALENPIACESLRKIASSKKQAKPDATAVIAVSDNTRPVPYAGQDGILVPILNVLLECGYKQDQIVILVATGTHRAMTKSELEKMLDPKVFQLGLTVVNHDCHAAETLEFIGNTERGTEVWIDKRYMEADLKIATGLIESHFMAGASGGRKAICPGLIGEKTTLIFHGAKLMADERSTNLVLDGNPVHEEAVEVAKMAGVDFLVNVTLDGRFRISGIFCGNLQKAHLAGVKQIKDDVQIKADPADIVITHGGYVGINHYQCAKCAVASLGILKKGGYLVMMANTTDSKNPVGSLKYLISLALLKETGPEAFLRTICSPDWTFLPDQWQVQQWAKVFTRIPMDHLYLYSPQLDLTKWDPIPGINGADLIGEGGSWDEFVSAALEDISKAEGRPLNEMEIAYSPDGPYSVLTAE